MFDALRDPGLFYWAAVTAALGWQYAACASLWTRWFNPGVIQHGIREPAGYRLGRATYWRLPWPAALAVVALSGIAPLSARLLPAGWATLLVAGIAVVIVALWLVNPPGMMLSYRAITTGDGQTAFESLTYRQLPRAIGVFLLFGLLPALLVGAGINWIVGRA
jgi:hypothetical protein